MTLTTFRSGGFAIHPPEYKDLQSDITVIARIIASQMLILPASGMQIRSDKQQQARAGFDSPAGYKRKELPPGLTLRKKRKQTSGEAGADTAERR